MIELTKRRLPKAAHAAPVLALAMSVSLASHANEVTISHYFTGELGKAAIDRIAGNFAEESGFTLKDSPVGHEDFKTDILVRAAGGSLPDVFSYWAGARVQFVVDSNSLTPIDDMWAREGMDDVIAKALADSATLYNGNRYLVPAGYHYAGFFYNKKVMDDAGVEEFPTDWEGFLALCDTLKEMGVAPIALGSKNRWPAQFWFDYLILRTAGPDYRASLMDGSASYDDPEVHTAMAMWKDLVDRGYFVENANADSWTDASDRVSRGEAAMTLMGTWITGYWNGNGLSPGEDYDFFEFPAITEGVPNAVVGPVDGWVISANAENIPGAEAWLAYFIKNVDAQVEWASVQGALSGNVNVDPSVYNSVMQRASAAVAAAEAFAFNYDLATPPPVAEVGLSMFAEFMDDPDNYASLLSDSQDAAMQAFDN